MLPLSTPAGDSVLGPCSWSPRPGLCSGFRDSSWSSRDICASHQGPHVMKMLLFSQRVGQQPPCSGSVQKLYSTWYLEAPTSFDKHEPKTGLAGNVPRAKHRRKCTVLWKRIPQTICHSTDADSKSHPTAHSCKCTDSFTGAVNRIDEDTNNKIGEAPGPLRNDGRHQCVPGTGRRVLHLCIWNTHSSSSGRCSGTIYSWEPGIERLRKMTP